MSKLELITLGVALYFLISLPVCYLVGGVLRERDEEQQHVRTHSKA